MQKITILAKSSWLVIVGQGLSASSLEAFRWTSNEIIGYTEDKPQWPGLGEILVTEKLPGQVNWIGLSRDYQL